MIGLKRGTVRLRPYHSGWARAFAAEKKRLKKKLGKLVIDIQHVGSTAIPRIHAKPIIDMSAGVRRLADAQKLIRPLSRMGYRFYRKFGQQILFAKGPDAKRTHYLHVMRYNGAKRKNDMFFREYLLTHPRRALAYAKLKKKLAKRFPDDRQRYSDGKDIFIKETLRRAKKRNVLA